MNKKAIMIVIFSLSVLAIGVSVWYLTGNQKAVVLYPYIAVKKGDLTEEVKLTGAVKAAEEAKLSFQVSGKVSRVNVKVGDKVKAGQALIELNNSDARADLAQSGASVSVAKAQLMQLESNLELQILKKQEMLKGARPEEVELVTTQLANAEKALKDAEENLKNGKTKADIDYQNAKNNINNFLPDAYTKAFDALNRQTAGFFNNANSTDLSLTFDTPLDSQKKSIVEMNRILAMEAVSKLNIYRGEVNPDSSNGSDLAKRANEQLQVVWDYLDSSLTALNYTVASSNFSQSQIDAYRNNVNQAITSINTIKTSLNNYDQNLASVSATNNNLIQIAEIAVTNATNAVNVARDTLTLKKAGATSDQIASQDVVIKQAQAAIEVQKAQISVAQASSSKVASQFDKTVIKAPVDGTITNVIPKSGETIVANQPVIDLMTMAKFQLETFVSEADLLRVQMGSVAEVTLDSFGSDVKYQAKVISVDPTATINKSNVTYKVILEFDKEESAVKPGLSANIKIVVRQANDVLMIPESSIIKEGENRYVIVNNGTEKGEKRLIEVGLTTNDGWADVIKGLTDSDQVADFGALLK